MLSQSRSAGSVRWLAYLIRRSRIFLRTFWRYPGSPEVKVDFVVTSSETIWRHSRGSSQNTKQWHVNFVIVAAKTEFHQQLTKSLHDYALCVKMFPPIYYFRGFVHYIYIYIYIASAYMDLSTGICHGDTFSVALYTIIYHEVVSM